jgi:tRNA-dihydrouridine synthase
MSVLKSLPRPFFVLAPMDDVTDTVFRQIVGRCAAPDLYFTEFVNVDGLQSPGRDRLMKKLLHTAADQPLIAQIWGKNPEHHYKTASELVDMGFVGIDINMGCPDKAITKNGCCSALINDRPLASAIIEAVQQGAQGRVPVSVKTRLGYNEVDFSWHEFLLGHNLAMLTIHGRTKKQMSAVPADWQAIAHIRMLRDTINPETLLVGNGDVLSRQQGMQLAQTHQLDGIMIGRGVFQDPFAFAAQSPWPQITTEQRLELFRSHVELFAHTWQHGDRPIHTLNKFCKIYVQGFEGAKELRERFMAARSADELLHMLRTATVAV